MSGIASVLLDQGYTVTGSDQVASANTRALADKGAQIWLGHDAGHVRGTDVVVASNAIATDNPEIVIAGELGIPV
ncbi:MAG: Mur ligase domain-containing protein, partial [Pseudomonadota bacterium]